MRGRLWWLWFVQTAAGGVCLAFGYETSNLANSTATMVIFSYLMQAACGATYGVVPFISKRSLGTVSGFVGAGGNTIAAIIQYIFFTNSQMTTPEAIQKLGITIMGFTTRALWSRAATSRCGAPCSSRRGKRRLLLLA